MPYEKVTLFSHPLRTQLATKKNGCVHPVVGRGLAPRSRRKRRKSQIPLSTTPAGEAGGKDGKGLRNFVFNFLEK